MGGAGYGNHDDTRPGEAVSKPKAPPSGQEPVAPEKPPEPSETEGPQVKPQGDEVDPGTG